MNYKGYTYSSNFLLSAATDHMTGEVCDSNSHYLAIWRYVHFIFHEHSTWKDDFEHVHVNNELLQVSEKE